MAVLQQIWLYKIIGGTLPMSKYHIADKWSMD